jgi:hypothetical protein
VRIAFSAADGRNAPPRRRHRRELSLIISAPRIGPDCGHPCSLAIPTIRRILRVVCALTLLNYVLQRASVCARLELVRGKRAIAVAGTAVVHSGEAMLT